MCVSDVGRQLPGGAEWRFTGGTCSFFLGIFPFSAAVAVSRTAPMRYYRGFNDLARTGAKKHRYILGDGRESVCFTPYKARLRRREGGGCAMTKDVERGGFTGKTHEFVRSSGARAREHPPPLGPSRTTWAAGSRE